jgi:hypothetical protein
MAKTFIENFTDARRVSTPFVAGVYNYSFLTQGDNHL